MTSLPPRSGESLPAESGETDGDEAISAFKSYLRMHPNCLDDDEELVTLLTPPARRHGDNVSDMQAYLIERLKADARRQIQHDEKLKAAIAADTIDERRIQRAIMAIAAQRSFEALIETITKRLNAILAVHAVALNIERPARTDNVALLALAPARGPIQLIAPGTVERRLPKGKLIAVGAAPGEHGISVPPGTGPIRSHLAARLTFSPTAPPGLLIIGAKSAARFHHATPVHRYTFLARIIESNIRLWLDLPPG